MYKIKCKSYFIEMRETITAHFVRRNVRSGDRTHHSRSLASEASM